MRITYLKKKVLQTWNNQMSMKENKIIGKVKTIESGQTDRQTNKHLE